MTKTLLELFSGTGSVGKVAKKMGYKVISVDNLPKFNPTIVADIKNWNGYKSLGKIDFLWSSPPCNSFSMAGIHLKHRHPKTLKAQTPTAVEGNKLLYATIRIYKYLKSKNPKLRFVMENPKGLMRHMSVVKQFTNHTTSYCKYGIPYKKDTDFFSNYPLKIKPQHSKDSPCPQKTYQIGAKYGSCEEKAFKQAISRIKGTQQEVLYRIPPKLIKDILLS